MAGHQLNENCHFCSVIILQLINFHSKEDADILYLVIRIRFSFRLESNIRLTETIFVVF